MRRIALGVVVTTALLGAVALGLWAARENSAGSGGAPPAPATATAPEHLPPGRSVIVTEIEGVPAGQLRYRRLTAETGGDSAEACLTFSAPLDQSGAVRYSDYLDLPAGLRVDVRVDGPRLCLSGFAFGSEHTVGVRPGLPGAKGETLPEAVSVAVGFGDRPASVSFGSGFVLPRETAEGLPITTVNVGSLDVTVLRVGDRLLARMREDLVEERRFYPYATEEVKEDTGRTVWRGTLPVTGPRNDAVVSLFPLAQAIGTPEPGAYLVVAAPAEPSRAAAASDDDEGGQVTSGQWVVQSDLGLTTFNGADGLTLMVRSLKTALPLPGVTLALIARNNDDLARLTTDRDGRARFDPGLLRGAGGLSPVMVMAYGPGGDFNFIDLRRPEFDLSDRGIEGRAPAGPVDAFVYTERGIYRPGESVHLVSLLRDPAARAIEGRTLVVKLNRPDGKEYRRFTLDDRGGGGGEATIALPAAAARGTWEATAHTDPEGPAVGRVTFEVQDFVPQRLGLSIGERPAVLRPGESLALAVEARFLYGAPAAGLGGEGDLVVEVDPAPFPKLKGYRWGLADERFDGTRTPLTLAETDGRGATTATGAVPADLAATLPLRADIGVAIREPGGRATGEHVYVPVRTRPVSIGIRPLFDDAVREGQAAGFEVLAVDAAGEPAARPGLEYRMLKDTSTWQWFRSDSRWRYERVPRETEIAAGRLDVGADGPATLRQPVEWGSYRLVVRDPDSGAATSVPFTAGWYGTASADRPDRLKIAADKAGYRAGDTARLHVESEAAGEALLVIANERVHETRPVHIPAGGADLAVPIRAEWGPGAYAMVTLYRPLAEKLGHAPVRAVGIAWLGLDPADRTLSVAVGTPERAQPRRPITVPVSVNGAKGHAFVTLAAVDQGILQLTRFRSPSPQGHFLSKRRLGVGMRDDYGRLIRGLAGLGDDQGGDSFGGKGLDVVPTRTVALFSGIVPLGPDGRALIPLDLPDFQGELRLMAVAYDADKVGSAETRLTVRDPLVAEVILPRFLAPGDQGRATVLVHNLDGAEGDYRIAVRAHDAVGGGAEEQTIALPRGQRRVFTVPVDGRSEGIGSVELSVAGPDGFAVGRAWPIQVRAPQLPETRQSVQAMAPGETVTLGADLLAGFLPGTGAAALSVSRWQGLDVPGLLRWLDRYPFGCLEQVTSRAMPLLYFNDVALLAGRTADQTIAPRVQEAIERVVAMQTNDGDFRPWGQWGDAADPGLSVFALDFLGRAVAKGYDVPAATMALGRRWLAGRAAHDSRDDVKAYALALLARQGQANAADLRYLHDSRPPESAIGFAHLGAALDAVGERARAASAFESARKALARQAELEATATPAAEAELKTLTRPYGSRLRDAYALAALLAGSGRAAQIPAALAAAGPLDDRAEATTTQDKAWMLLAAAEMGRTAGRLAVEIDGAAAPAGDPVSIPLDPAALARGISLRNAGEGEVFRVLSADGVPDQPLPAASNGIRVTKSVFTLAGRPVDLAQVRRNDRLVVVVEGRADAQVGGDYAVLDLLPAGWDIEGVLRPEQPGYAWVGRLSEATMRQARDDRYLAAFALPNYAMDRSDPAAPTRKEDSKTWDFKVAYVVRAVTAGSFALPAATAEHMYRPQSHARTAMGRLVVAE